MHTNNEPRPAKVLDALTFETRKRAPGQALALSSLLLALAGAPATKAAILTWTNVAGGNWNVANNWSPNQAPSTGDMVFVTNAGSYSVTMNVSASISNLIVGGATGTQTVSVAGGVLTLSTNSLIETNGALVLSSGLITGPGDLLIKGQFSWSGGTLSGPGGLVLTNFALVSLPSINTKSLARNVQNYTSVKYSGSGLTTAGVNWTNQSGSIFEVQGDGGVGYSGFGSLSVLQNYGTVTKTAGSGNATLQCVVNNFGTVAVSSGMLSLDGGGTSVGNFRTDTGCTNQFGGYSHILTTGATLTGPGMQRIGPSGTLRINTPLLVTNAFELSGVLGGTNVVIFAGSFSWAGGSMSEAGTTVFTNSANVNLTLGAFSRRVDNYTAVAFTGGTFSGASGAIWNNMNIGSFDIQGNGGFPSSYSAVFNNYGLLKKSAGAGNSSLQMTINNSGTVLVNSGLLGFESGGASSGSFQIASGCTNEFGGATHTLLGGASFSGGGLCRVWGTLDISTPLTITNRFELDGYVTGTNIVTFAGIFNWSGGTMIGPGKTVLANSATVTLTGGGISSRTIDNYTTVSFVQGTLTVSSGTVWNNMSGAIFDFQGNALIGGTQAVFNNYGLLRKSGGGGNSTANMALNNYGSVTVSSGGLGFSGGACSGIFQADAGCTNFFYGTNQLAAGVLLTGPGVFYLQGTMKFDIPLIITNHFVLGNSGQIAGTNTVVFTGTFDWLGGSMADSGKTVFTNSANVMISSGSHYGRTIDNYTIVIVTGGGLQSANLATWNNMAGATFDIQGNGGISYSGTNIFNNYGLLQKSSGASSMLRTIVNNFGLISVSSGMLSLNWGGTSSGSFYVAAGCTNQFGAFPHTFLPGANFGGPGVFRVACDSLSASCGILNFTAPITITNAFELNAGLNYFGNYYAGGIAGTNTVIFSGPFNWVAGIMMDTGKTVFAATAQVSLNSGNLSYRTIDNYTTVSYTGAAFTMSAGAIWNNLPGSVFDIQASGYFNGGGTFNNAGTLKKTGAAGPSGWNVIVNNSNSVQVTSGLLGLNAGGTSTGLFYAAAGCTNQFAGSIHTLLPGTQFTGPGLYQIGIGGTLAINFPLTITNAFELNAADLYHGGGIGGSAVVTFTGPFNWVSGSMFDTGKTVFSSSAQVSVNRSSGGTFSRVIDNYGRTVTDHGNLAMASSGIWNNMVGGTFVITNGTIDGGGIFNNFGTFELQYNCIGCHIGCYVTNAGTLRVTSGAANFYNPCFQTAGMTELAGGTLSGPLVGGPTLNIIGGTLTGIGTVNSVRNNGTNMPGSPFGLMSVGGYTNTGLGTYNVQLAGTSAGVDHDQMRVGGTAVLSGSLQVSLLSGFLPAPGNIFTVMTYSAHSGVFTDSNAGVLGLNVLYLPTNLLLIAGNALPFADLTVLGGTTQFCCKPFNLTATASDLDGVVTNITFLVNGVAVANSANSAFTNSIELDVPGNYLIQAQAFDDKGGSGFASTLVTVVSAPPEVLSLGGFRSNGSFKLCMQGQGNRSYEILANTNLNTTNWISLGAMEPTNGMWLFYDANALNFRYRYYRAHQLP